jgi:chemotaxis protein methyltransferase CheR
MALLEGASLDSALAEWASRRLGFDRRALRFERLRLVAEREAQRLGQGAFEQALAHGEAGLDAALVAAATVGETYFFRQREHFDLLSELPFRGSPRTPLLAWSAACASGEEAYSLAVSLRQKLGLEAPALQVWGTDINEAALVSARAAAYGRWSFRASVLETGSPDPAAEALRDEALRQQVLDPATQACVRFARHNLLEAPSFDGGAGARFHVIFCRNALVYFQPEAAEVALGHLVRALVPGGWLILGNMDISSPPAHTRRVGPAHLCVFERLDSPVEVAAAIAAPAPVAALPKAPRRRAKAPVAPSVEQDLDPEQAVDWHRAVLAQLEAGEDSAALLELQALVEAFPRYLPGWFEHGLALNRRGQRLLAAESLRKTLRLSRGLDPAQIILGPEPLSVDFYVGNAEAFLQSLGDAP